MTADQIFLAVWFAGALACLAYCLWSDRHYGPATFWRLERTPTPMDFIIWLVLWAVMSLIGWWIVLPGRVLEDWRG